MRRIKKQLMLYTFMGEYNKATKNNPIHNNKVLFISDVRTVLDGNLGCIYDQLEGSDYERIVICKDIVKNSITRAEIKEIAVAMATAKYIFMEDVLSFMNVISPRAGQKFIQLWHAAGAYKKFGFSRLASEGGSIRISSGYRKYTHATVSSEAIADKYAEAFDVDISCVKGAGVPRTDMFFDENKKSALIESVYNDYPILRGKRIMLFAPTYRGRRPAEATYGFNKLDFNRLAADMRRISKESGREHIFVIKWHPAMVSNGQANKIKRVLETNKDVLLDMSEVRDINKLLLVTDLMITDYSSVIFDYSLLNKPIVYFPYDLDEYYNDRSFYFTFDEYVYGRVVFDQGELIEAIEAADMSEDSRAAFHDKFMAACNGHSSEQVCQWVFSK